jgi:hypothetical protein
MSPKIWQPTATKCSECKELELIPINKKEKAKEGNIDLEKKLCDKFGWEIMNNVAGQFAACKIEQTRKSVPRPRRKKKESLRGEKHR